MHNFKISPENMAKYKFLESLEAGMRVLKKDEFELAYECAAEGFVNVRDTVSSDGNGVYVDVIAHLLEDGVQRLKLLKNEFKTRSKEIVYKPCLKCGKTFKSSGKFNRVCQSCKEQNERYGGAAHCVHKHHIQ